MSVKREGCVTTRSYADGQVNQTTHASEQAAIDYAASFAVAAVAPPKAVKAAPAKVVPAKKPAKKQAKPPVKKVAKKVAAKTKRR